MERCNGAKTQKVGKPHPYWSPSLEGGSGLVALGTLSRWGPAPGLALAPPPAPPGGLFFTTVEAYLKRPLGMTLVPGAGQRI